MKVIDYKEAMKCLDEVEDCEDKTYAKALLEWAINKRTFEAVPISVIEDIKVYVRKECNFRSIFEAKRLEEFIDRKVNEAINKKPDPIRGYKCDPKKNIECRKTACYERGGPCCTTLNPEYAKEE